MKITVSYLDDSELEQVINALKPLLLNAKIRKNNTYKPYKHAYIIVRNDKKPSN